MPISGESIGHRLHVDKLHVELGRGGAELYDWLWGGFGGSGAAPSSPTDCRVRQRTVNLACALCGPICAFCRASSQHLLYGFSHRVLDAGGLEISRCLIRGGGFD